VSSAEDGSGHGAARAVAAAAASGAAALAVKRALGRGARREHAGLGPVLEAAWSSARETLLPALEESAEHLGRYVAENAPDTLRDSILPRFLDSFREAHERRRTEAEDED
jgi:hypothetical protein